MTGDASDQSPFRHRENASRPGRGPSLAGAPPYSAAVPTACLVSFRLGGGDGVAIEAAKWAAALGVLGWDVVTVAGSGPVDVVVPGLAMDAAEAPSAAEVTGALAGADLVVVENLCSLPLNPAASSVVAAACAGRPTVLHHHDLPWQRPHLAHLPAAARRPGLGPRHHQRAEPSRAGGARLPPARHDALQLVRPGPGAGRPGRPAARPGPGRLRAAPAPTDPGLGAQEHRRRRWRWPRRSGASTGCWDRRRTATGPSSSRIVERAGCPVILGAPPGGWTHRRRLRRVRRRPVALVVGGLRQSLGRVRHPPTPAGHRALPGGNWSWRPSASVGSTRSTRPPWETGWPPRTPSCSSTTTTWPPAASTWPTSRSA